MLFMIVETIEDVEAVGARFTARGRLLPEAASYLASWSALEGRLWFQLMEAPDPSAIAEWTQRWADLVSFEIHAVVPSEEFWAQRGTRR
jgi:Protein of unknown function (DUF3303)